MPRANHWVVALGVLAALGAGRAIALAGPLAIPALAEIPWLAAIAESLHALVGTALVGLIGLHVGTALKHHFVDGDTTLVRMATGRNVGACPASR